MSAKPARKSRDSSPEMLKRAPKSISFLVSCLVVGSSGILLLCAYEALDWRLTRQLQSLGAVSESEARSVTAALAALRAGTLRCGQVQGLFPGRIPPVVHWTNRDERVLNPHQDLLLTWPATMGQSAAYMLWDDVKIERLLSRHYPELWQRYKHLGAGIMRSDIGRLAIIHHVGGIYTDMDVRLLRNFLSLLRNHTSLWSQEPLEHAYYLYDRRRLLSNALFMSQAGHPFLSYVLKTWPAWFDLHWHRRSSHLLRNSGSAVAMTGPLMLTNFLDEYEKSGRSGRPVVAQPDAFQPRWDTGALPGVAMRRCAFTAVLTLEQRDWCSLLRKQKFQARTIPPDSYAVHMYLHTGYGGPIDYRGTRAFSSLLNASSCVV